MKEKARGERIGFVGEFWPYREGERREGGEIGARECVWMRSYIMGGGESHRREVWNFEV